MSHINQGQYHSTRNEINLTYQVENLKKLISIKTKLNEINCVVKWLDKNIINIIT